MGLIKAIAGAAGGILGDQWKEYFYCDALDEEVLVSKGQKRVSGRSSNTKGADNIITGGSVIAVNEGQCMLIVEQGKVVDICAEAGEYRYDASTEPSILNGNLGEDIGEVFENLGKRFTFGGQAPNDQRVYFVNTKEVIGNKYGTANPIPFRVVDEKIGLDMDISLRCFGEYSYRITNPILFYTNVCGNITTVFEREQIDSQLKSELMTALQPTFAKLSALGIRYSALPAHTMEIANTLNDVLSKQWKELRGIEIVSFAINSLKASEQDEEMIKELQKSAVFTNPTMAAAHMVQAQAEAMKSAASNQNAGPTMGFMGMNMANAAGGVNIQDLFAMGQQPQQQQPQQSQQGMPKVGAEEWICTCGTVNKGKFCSECGAPRPAAGWICACGQVNEGKFCSECGAKRPW